MLNAMQRLGFMSSATFEHKKLAVEMAEVIIKWELQRIRDENNATEVNDQIFINNNYSLCFFTFNFFTFPHLF